MKMNQVFVNIGIFFWCSAIIAWLLSFFYISLFLFVINFLFLLLHFVQKKVDNMFGKKQKKNADEHVIHYDNQDVEVNGCEREITKEKKITIISHDVVFEGNIKSNQSIYVYGKLIGDIYAENNTVNVMFNGEVTGNITSNTLVVNGTIHGECHSEDIMIEGNGQVNGTVFYKTLEIKKGGGLVGCVQLSLNKNIISNIKEKIVPLLDEPDNSKI